MEKYDELVSWVETSENDHVIAEYLRKKILKESNSTIAFYGVALLTSLMFLIFEAMIKESLIYTVVFLIVSMIFIGLIYDLIHSNNIKKKLIDKRGFRTCEVEAFDINDKYNEKYCRIKDKEGNVYSELVGYYSYFGFKETEGVFVVLPKISKKEKDYCVVFPKSFLKMEKKTRK